MEKIDKNIKKIFSLYVLGKTNREIGVEITNQSFFVLDSWNYEGFVIKKLIMTINVVEFMYVKLCYKSSTSKFEKSNSNINIFKILHYLLIFIFFSPEKWWHYAKWTDNQQVFWND